MKQAYRFLLDIAAVVAFYLLFTTVGWSAYHISSGSLEPTLEVGDRIFISKYAYGYNRFSVPLNPGFLGEGRLFEDGPQRGDIALFRLPYLDNIDFIKRVVGLPGDTIQMKAGRLFINGEMVERTYVRDVRFSDYQGVPRHVTEYDETLPGGLKHRIYEQSDHAARDNTDVYAVPAGHYFMMGDNRDNSADSRENLRMGFVDKKYLVGRAAITTFSLYDCDQGKPIACMGPVPVERFFRAIN